MIIFNTKNFSKNQRNVEKFYPITHGNKPTKMWLLTEKKPEEKEIEEKEALTCSLHHGSYTSSGDTSERRRITSSAATAAAASTASRR